MRTRQYFTWEAQPGEMPGINGSKERTWLLMPNEVEEFKRLTGPGFDLSFEYAFQRITGREYNKTVILHQEFFE